MTNKINNNIEESRVTFEVSKLLKEKNFDCPTTHYYALDGFNLKECGVLKKNTTSEHNENQLQIVKSRKSQIHIAPAPTTEIAIEWIRVNFGLTVRLTTYALGWQYHIDHCPLPYTQYANDGRVDCETNFRSPQEALNEGLLHILKHLI